MNWIVLEERQKREEVKAELDCLISLGEITWRHKSRATWLKEGDKNAKYVHKMANSHRRYNQWCKVSSRHKLLVLVSAASWLT